MNSELSKIPYTLVGKLKDISPKFVRSLTKTTFGFMDDMLHRSVDKVPLSHFMIISANDVFEKSALYDTHVFKILLPRIIPYFGSIEKQEVAGMFHLYKKNSITKKRKTIFHFFQLY